MTTLWRLLSHKHLTFRTLAGRMCRLYPWQTSNRVVRFVPAKKQKAHQRHRLRRLLVRQPVHDDPDM
eukprot:5381049-Lingulodinium_polyedra.AAC.1